MSGCSKYADCGICVKCASNTMWPNLWQNECILDTDGDGVWNAIDQDDDNDSFLDSHDATALGQSECNSDQQVEVPKTAFSNGDLR